MLTYKPQKPVRAVFLTSIRDVGICDLNGRMVSTKEGRRYMEGLIERTVRECGPGGGLHGLLELAGVIYDDTPKDLAGSDYPLVPGEGLPWIFPLDMKDHHGHSVVSMTTHLPSIFRLLPLDDAEGRRVVKHAFETSILELMHAARADILISDHYMARIEFLINGLGLNGRVLNMHPAVTKKNHPFCFRGPHPTADAIAMAKSGTKTVTGATLHIVNEVIDDGPIILCEAVTPVHADDVPAELRWRNYQKAKFPVFVRGMQKYLAETFVHS